MNSKLMISYSRRQTPFVDRLADELEDEGYSVWLDYQNLVPAQPWYQQIEAGISQADIVVLVVSQAAVQSRNVESEWRLALQCKKRIILVIFEAVPLPTELQSMEWVDFRINHKKGLTRLQELLENPPTEVESPAPQSGFTAPPLFWLAVLVSCVVLLVSIPAWWTFLIPYLFVPLPRQIIRRNYSFTRITTALLFLPVVILFTFAPLIFAYSNVSLYLNMAKRVPAELLFDPQVVTYIGIYISIVVSASWLLLGLLLTPAMQRRALPEAARLRFANPLMPDIKRSRTVPFVIDAAPEDRRFAADLGRGLEAYGHHMVTSAEKAEAVFVLISTYKKSTKYDPDRQAVYPILLQSVSRIDAKLERIQWIDFRKGIGKTKKLAQLLPDPQRLLKALAIPPTGSQELYPLMVNVLQYFYLLTAMIGGGSILLAVYAWTAAVYRFEFGRQEFWRFAGQDILRVLLLVAVLLPGFVIYSLRGLRSRRGGTAAVYPLLALTLLQVILYLASFGSILYKLGSLPGGYLEGIKRLGMGAAASASAFSVFVSTAIIYALILLVTIVLLIFRWRELYRWFPQRQAGSSVGIVENALLLYTPLRQRALALHVVFHSILALLCMSVMFEVAQPLLPCFLFIVIGIRGLAMLVSK